MIFLDKLLLNSVADKFRVFVGFQEKPSFIRKDLGLDENNFRKIETREPERHYSDTSESSPIIRRYA